MRTVLGPYESDRALRHNVDVHFELDERCDVMEGVGKECVLLGEAVEREE